MIIGKRNPVSFGILTALFLVLIGCFVGCAKGNLGLSGGAIHGNALDSRTQTGISAVNVIATSGDPDDAEGGGVTKYTKTDTNGNYYLNDLRPAKWTLTFDHSRYESIIDETEALSVVVANSKTYEVPPVRMMEKYESEYVTVKGTLKDGISGTTIYSTNAQFIFGQESFSNRQSGELITGFMVPASTEAINVTITVEGYKTHIVELDDLRSDRNLGTISLEPETYSIVGRWQDVPGWVHEANPNVSIFAYSGNRVVATTDALIADQQFTIIGIPKGVSVSVSAEIKGYRMNGPITVHPSGDFQGQIYQNFSLTSNFSQIYRDVRVIISGTNIVVNDFVGAYCEQTGTRWSQTQVSNPPGWTIGTPRIIDLGTNQVPTGYTFEFKGYVLGDGTVGNESVMISSDGPSAQVVTIQVN